jgi:hypothetical protein
MIADSFIIYLQVNPDHPQIRSLYISFLSAKISNAIEFILLEFQVPFQRDYIKFTADFAPGIVPMPMPTTSLRQYPIPLSNVIFVPI